MKRIIAAYIAGVVTVFMLGATSQAPDLREVNESLKRIAFSVETLAGQRGK
jgi:hypothetical protein